MPSKKVATRAAQPLTTASGRPSLVKTFAAKFGIDDEKLVETLKMVAFRQRPRKDGSLPQPVTNEQLAALLIVANEYGLNPFLKELYAFPQDGGIVPIVGVDGWIRIMNQHPQFEWQTWSYPDCNDDEIPPWIECEIKRRDRAIPTKVREYYEEVVRDTGPWKQHPRRMLRHKATIQCIRVAFGFAGIYDPDEAERIVEIDITPQTKSIVKDEPTQSEAALVTSAQVGLLRDKLSDAEILEDDVILHFDLKGDLNSLRFDQVQDVLDWIDKSGK